jgi:hypothetical protein
VRQWRQARAEGDADAELPFPRSADAAEHAVDTDGGEKEGQRGKTDHQHA